MPVHTREINRMASFLFVDRIQTLSKTKVSELPAVPDTAVEALVHMIVMHIHLVYSGADRGKTDWLLNWFAHQVQSPEARHGVDVVIFGESMTGRGCVARFHRMVLGHEDSHFAKWEKKYRHLEYPGDDSTKIFVQVKRQVRMMQRINRLTTTGPRTNLFITTRCPNKRAAFLKDGRFAVFQTRMPYRKQDMYAYFDLLWKHMTDPVVQRAWLQFLLGRDLSKFQAG